MLSLVSPESRQRPGTNAGRGARSPRRSAVIVSMTLLLSVLAASVWYWDAFHREILDYYANVTKRWGLPEGVKRLSAEEVSHRSVSVVLVRRGRLNAAHEIRVVNSAGLTPPVGFGLPLASVSELNPLPSAGSDGPVSSELIQLTRVTFSSRLRRPRARTGRVQQRRTAFVHDTFR